MKQFLLILVLLTIPSIALATEERVAPPQDQGMWYVSVFGTETDAKYQQLTSWFKSNEGLKALRDQTHYNEYTTDQVRFKRYEKSLPGLPCIRIQDEKGKVRSEYWSENIPITVEALYQGIRRDLQNKAEGCLFGKRRRKNCPNRNKSEPPPVDPPPADPPAGPPVLPEIVPVEPEVPAVPGFPWLLAALSAIIGASIGVAQGFKKEHMDGAAPQITKL